MRFSKQLLAIGLAVGICALTVSFVQAQYGEVLGTMAPSARPLQKPTSSVREQTPTKTNEQVLLERERKISNSEFNQSEARRQFEADVKLKREEFNQKTREAALLRKTCLQEKAVQIKELKTARELQRRELQATCQPKAIETTLTKPVAPTLDGLDEQAIQAAKQQYALEIKAYRQQLNQKLQECKMAHKEFQLETRKLVLEIQEQCSTTERSVLGLSTEIPIESEYSPLP